MYMYIYSLCLLSEWIDELNQFPPQRCVNVTFEANRLGFWRLRSVEDGISDWFFFLLWLQVRPTCTGSTKSCSSARAASGWSGSWRTWWRASSSTSASRSGNDSDSTRSSAKSASSTRNTWSCWKRSWNFKYSPPLFHSIFSNVPVSLYLSLSLFLAGCATRVRVSIVLWLLIVIDGPYDVTWWACIQVELIVDVCTDTDAARGGRGQARSRSQVRSGETEPAAEARVRNHPITDPSAHLPEGEPRFRLLLIIIFGLAMLLVSPAWLISIFLSSF